MIATSGVYKSFGQFLTVKREERRISLREFARQLGVSAPYMTEVEKDRAAPLMPERLSRAAEILDLSKEERSEMYDIVGKQKDCVAPDLPEYIKGKEYVSVALRTARDLGAGEADWNKFIEELKKRKG